MILRRLFGEAGVNAKGLWVKDYYSNLDLVIGNIAGELAQDFARAGLKGKATDLKPVWGVHISKRF